MVLGMSVETFTFLHVVISLVGIMTGFIVVALMLQSAPIAGWNAFFLISTILTSVTGFFFPIKGLDSGARRRRDLADHAGRGAVSRSTARSSPAAGARSMSAPPSSRSISTSSSAIVQSFNKFAYLNKFAPTGSEPPFAVTQGIVLILFIIIGVAAVRRYRPVD